MSRLVFSPLSVWLLLALILQVIVGLPLLFLGGCGSADSVVVGSFVIFPYTQCRDGARKPRGVCAVNVGYDVPDRSLAG